MTAEIHGQALSKAELLILPFDVNENALCGAC